MENLKIFILFLFLAALSSCNSELSTGKVEKIALIGATIEITQNPTDKKDNGISIDLFDGSGNIIRNDSIKIIVNGIEGELFHIKGLYYTDDSHYGFSNIPINKIYHVEIKLTDGKKYLLGTINALSEEKIENIECDEQGDLNKNTVIKWKNLKAIDELLITPLTLLKKPDSTEDSNSSKDVVIKKIGSSGELTFPKSDYVDSTSTIRGYYLRFQTTKSGQINPQLLENSKITISTVIEKNISFEKKE